MADVDAIGEAQQHVRGPATLEPVNRHLITHETQLLRTPHRRASCRQADL
jgi:hypothetical protein